MSNINFMSINEYFPVAGQDNDTQVFRDNFGTIKDSLRTAKDEITALQDDYVSLTKDNNLGFNVIQNAIGIGIREKVVDNPVTLNNVIQVAWDLGSYFILNFNNNYTINLSKLPGDSTIPNEGSIEKSVGKLILEIYSTNNAVISAGNFTIGKTYTITDLGNTNWNTVANTVDVIYAIGDTFIAQTAGSGTGIALQHWDISFSTEDGAPIKKNSSFPGNLTIGSSAKRIILEVWGRSATSAPSYIFLNYIGQFA